MPVDLHRQLPSVNELLSIMSDLEHSLGHQRVTDTIRQCLNDARIVIRSGGQLPSRDVLLADIRQTLEMLQFPISISYLINATGIIIHTNLGRVVLSQSAQKAMLQAASAYQPLEYDLQTGQRGRRGASTEQLIVDITHAEDALVVNNCAAATVLMLSAVARGKGVVISRGELVEIGGGFRIPEIMEQSGARLIEVGTTNKTRLRDFHQAVQTNPDVAAILCAHPSNFKMVGFTETVPLNELTTISLITSGGAAGDFVPVLHDLGSGALLDTSAYGLSHEPMPQESVAAGVVLTAFSGDKLLGGPQAGIIVGTRSYVERCRRHPLARAFRADKFTLAALGATVAHYMRGEAETEVPVWRMIATTKQEINQRACDCINRLQPWLQSRAVKAQIIDGESAVGGGSLPGETLPTALIALVAEHSNLLLQELRNAPIPVIARIQESQVLLDLRTVLNDDEFVEMVTAV
jgi:L-seryl-tRNA(Ser) seleniumtransferase